MQNLLLAVAVALCPLLATAEPTPPANEPAETVPMSGVQRILLISAGIVGGLILADMLIGGAVTEPIVEIVTPAMQEARAAGAVFGRQIAAATGARDAAARADLLYAFVLGTGALLGGWFISRWLPPAQDRIMDQ